MRPDLKSIMSVLSYLSDVCNRHLSDNGPCEMRHIVRDSDINVKMAEMSARIALQ